MPIPDGLPTETSATLSNTASRSTPDNIPTEVPPPLVNSSKMPDCAGSVPMPCSNSPRLDGLPTEVLFSIISFTSPFIPHKQHDRLINQLAATNRTLRNIAEGYSRSLLQEATNMNRPLRTNQTYRGKYIRWLNRTCQMCKKPSRRKAILDPTETLCKACDYKIPKITMTLAAQFPLSKLDLFTPNPLYPFLPPLRHGRYTCMGGSATMFHANDVFDRRELYKSALRQNPPSARLQELRQAAPSAANDHRLLAVLLARRYRRVRQCWQDIGNVLGLTTPSDISPRRWDLPEVKEILDEMRAWDQANTPLLDWSLLGHKQYCPVNGSNKYRK
ncbi:uncharacterized protein EI97DRAFT_501490 [Westerdykella ornata]|uniref:F-box domain-containing protein n=1 Tax=Westerdykella ornata TaxID=318751 RepID=A0A6A6JIH8_WESOR|nr:uncharacterized protein EI97DRAFT_501490 [Westerdykella ornata]KAF2276227.1 hypothetical protein EI97DRAFT_501490 [Westerdykella ornata]